MIIDRIIQTLCYVFSVFVISWIYNWDGAISKTTPDFL